MGREIFSLMKDEQSKLVPFLHLPLQAASNKVLKDMRRKYSFEDYQDFIQLAYREVPDICNKGFTSCIPATTRLSLYEF